MENKSFTQNPNFGFKNSNININDERPPMPPDYLVPSIIGTVLGALGGINVCFIGLILGIIAIVFSTQVRSKYNRGDYFGAQKSAKTAKILSIIAIIVGGIGSVIILTIIIIAAIGSIK